MARLFTIPAEQPFVDALAHGLLREARDDPLALANTLVLLPTRRAGRSLHAAFVRQSGGGALILPRIQPLGDLDPEELPDPADLDGEIPPALAPMRRRLLLATLLRGGRRMEEALRLAADLEALLDEMHTEQVPLAALERVVPDELALHWQQTRAILAVLGEAWQGVLDAEGAIEPAERRHRLLNAIARRWREQPPSGRIVAAGSTGSIPATRALLQAIAGLPAGAVVLPGLDQDLDDASWERLEPTHPQHGLKQLLEALGVERRVVALWPGAAPGGSAERVRLLGEALRPAATASGWQELAAPAPAALAGLAIDEHPDLPAEARAIALRMRAALETRGRTAALVTPDRDLARRVALELRRWRIEVDDSAGTPLDRTLPGVFLLLIAALAGSGIAAVPLLALLHHPLARGGERGSAFRAKVRDLERGVLRGPRLETGFAAIQAELERRRLDPRAANGVSAARLEELCDWLAGVERMLAPLVEILGSDEVALDRLVAAHGAVAEALAADASGTARGLWDGEAGALTATLMSELGEAAGGLPLDPAGYPALLAHLMAERVVRPPPGGHPRLFIWGQLEARLQQADVIILGSLNEGAWPRAPAPSPWLGRAMRHALGLTPPERRIGQGAHDFAQAAAATEVVLSRAAKDADFQPTVPSRWLVRLQAVLRVAGEAALRQVRDPRWAAWAQRLDEVAVPRASPRPTPAPPVAARPRALSVSDIGLWMRDPFALYAKRILRLRPLEPLDADAGALERGKIIHAALERFVRRFPRDLPADPLRELCAIGEEVFTAFEHRPQVMALWWPRFARVARWVIHEEQARRPQLAEVVAEVEGRLEIDAPAGPFAVSARADRLERRCDGTVAVIDYKTGALPKPRDVVAGLQPQLPLEAAIVAGGGFAELGPMEVAELAYWELRDAGASKAPASAPVDELAQGALDGLARLVAHYDHEATTYPARWVPPTARFGGDYEHLARSQEWPE